MTAPDPAEDMSAKYADDTLALRFSEWTDGRLVYVSAWNTWLCWDGCRWRYDDLQKVRRWARELLPR